MCLHGVLGRWCRTGWCACLKCRACCRADSAVAAHTQLMQVGDVSKIAVPDKETAAEPAPAARKAAPAPAPAAAAAAAAAAGAAASAAAAAAEQKRKAAVEEAKKALQQEQVRGVVEV